MKTKIENEDCILYFDPEILKASQDELPSNTAIEEKFYLKLIQRRHDDAKAFPEKAEISIELVNGKIDFFLTPSSHAVESLQEEMANKPWTLRCFLNWDAGDLYWECSGIPEALSELLTKYPQEA